MIQVAEPFFVDVIKNSVCLLPFSWQCDNATKGMLNSWKKAFQFEM
jgi:hypothetical protein